MNKVRVAICEDYQNDRDLYEKRCRDIAKKYDIPLELKKYENGNDLLFDLEEPRYYTSIDIILLNVHMPGPDGIEVAERARKLGYKKLIIFITASREHYEPAFDVRGFNYITKGKEHNEERFEKVFLTALKEARELNSKAIVLSAGGVYKQIDISEIRYFQVKKNLITIYYGNKSFEFISTLNKLENQLFSHGFYRVQKGFLISLHYVKCFNYNEVTLKNEVKIPIGRKYYKGLKEKMDEMAGRI